MKYTPEKSPLVASLLRGTIFIGPTVYKNLSLRFAIFTNNIWSCLLWSTAIRATSELLVYVLLPKYRHTHSLNSAASDFVFLMRNTDCASCMRPLEARCITRDRSITHSLQRKTSFGENPISQRTFLFCLSSGGLVKIKL